MPENNEISIYNPQDESVVVYRSEDANVTLEVRLANETVWLTQQQMTVLFNSTKQNISLHINNIFREGELQKEATVKDYLTVQQEGGRMVNRWVRYYNLDDQVYHCGHSLKDLGQKLSAVSLLGINAEDILKQIR